MLYRFSVKNFKNFKDELLFDLSQIKSYEFSSNCIKNGLIKNALIYGPNGIGKSNLGLAIFDIVSNITDKEKCPERYTHYLNPLNKDEIAEFEYTFKFGNNFISYRYGKKSLEELIYESIKINNDEVISYDRRTGENNALINLKGADTLTRDLSLIKISIAKYIKTNAVLEEDTNNSIIKEFFKFVDGMLFYKSLDEKFYIGYDVGSHIIFENIVTEADLLAFQTFLNAASVECKLGFFEKNNKKTISCIFEDKMIDFWEICSTGTRALSVLYYWLQRMKTAEEKPSFVFVDEFDAFYQQQVAELIINELQSLDFQTILTTHNTALLNNDLIRPDCALQMTKNKIKSLANLTIKEIRKAHNIEKLYRAGTFNEE
jgi:AAA15 family ATPase/GTPase